MNMKFVFLFVLILLSTSLSGCWDVSEPERMYYIHAAGIDYKDGQYEVYTQIIDFVNTAKSEQPSREKVQTVVGHATGKTMDEAFYQLYHSIDEKVFWGHLSFIVLSEEVLKQGRVNQVIESFIRFQETRYQIWVYSTKGSVQDVLLVTPLLNKAITLSKLSDPLNSYKQESYIEPLNFRKLIIRLNEPSHEVAIPYITVQKNWKTMEGPDKVTHLKGVSVITPHQFKGFIEGNHVRGLQWLTKESKSGRITVRVDGSGENYVTAIIDKIKSKIEPRIKDGQVTFDIHVDVNVIVTLLHGKVKDKDLRKAIESQIEKEIRDTYKEALEKDIDIYRLSEKLYRSNLKEWKKREKDGKIALTEDSIALNIVVQKVDAGRKSLTETVDH